MAPLPDEWEGTTRSIQGESQQALQNTRRRHQEEDATEEREVAVVVEKAAVAVVEAIEREAASAAGHRSQAHVAAPTTMAVVAWT